MAYRTARIRDKVLAKLAQSKPQAAATPPLTQPPFLGGGLGQGKRCPMPKEWWRMDHPTFGKHRVHVVRVWPSRSKAIVETEDGERHVSDFTYLHEDPNPKGARK